MLGVNGVDCLSCLSDSCDGRPSRWEQEVLDGNRKQNLWKMGVLQQLWKMAFDPPTAEPAALVDPSSAFSTSATAQSLVPTVIWANEGGQRVDLPVGVVMSPIGMGRHTEIVAERRPPTSTVANDLHHHVRFDDRARRTSRVTLQHRFLLPLFRSANPAALSIAAIRAAMSVSMVANPDTEPAIVPRSEDQTGGEE